ncbi:putative inactive receptor kinase [Acorus gramineus]|uniref:Inactive receptor kinase n=1 Tax=Acorus gramineus TaxID=55184 RepID=A0AAV9BMF8_ACOGR|nr:putative inactive receptor kinase [Acorus gramineus]
MHLLLLLLLLSSSAAQPPLPSPDALSLLEFKKGILSDPLNLITSTWSPSSLSPSGCPLSWHGVVCDPSLPSASVVSLSLHNLSLSGDLKFSTLTSLSRLRNLSLSSNSLSGRLVPSLASLSSLVHLDLSRNLFYGPIPSRILTDLTNLNHLNLSFNRFSGWVPDAGFGKLQQLRALDLRSNELRGDLAPLVASMRSVEYVDLSENFFYGGFPADPEDLTGLGNTLHYLNVSSNRLGGGFFSAAAMGKFRNLEVLDLGHNEFTGQMPVPFGTLFSLQVFRLGDNQFYGPVPDELLGDSFHLTEVDLGLNGFTGSIGNITSTTLRVLNLSSNGLTGSLPLSLGNCVTVDLSGNGFGGDLSVMRSWGGDMLEFIDLSSNQLLGSLPNETLAFGKLSLLRLSNNSLEGALPLVLGSYPKLTVIDMSHNKLSGPILASLFTSSTLKDLNLSGNSFSGEIPIRGARSSPESLDLPSTSHLESLDLSGNSLSGPLAPEIGNLQKLRVLSLGKNSLSGEIPKEMEMLDGLQFLDLSNNEFEGSIPDNLPQSLEGLSLSNNDLSGTVPENLRRFPDSSFHPGNVRLILPGLVSSQNGGGGALVNGGRSHPNSRKKVAIIVGSIGGVLFFVLCLMAYFKLRHIENHGENGFEGKTIGRDVMLRRFTHTNIFGPQRSNGSKPNSTSFSNSHLLTSASRSISGQKELLASESVKHGYSEPREAASEPAMPEGADDRHPSSAWKSSPGSPLDSSPRFIEQCLSEQPVTLSVYSPDRLAGELFFLDSSLMFTGEELSRAPAEVLGRSSHGTSYKATLDNGHMLAVKWLRVGLVKRKKEFAKEAKRVGTIRHLHIISWRGYYWGPREQERLIISDYVDGDSLALHLYESTPRRYSPLAFSQRLKIAVDVARCLHFLHHDRGLPHGNLKPTNILLAGPDYTAQLTDYGLHRLMTPTGVAEQILNMGALGYRAPELANTPKPFPSFKADVYAFGVIVMELLTRRSAGDIISGQSGAVDLTDWVRMCAREGRGMECFDRDIMGLGEAPEAAEELLAVSLKCILPVDERPNMRTVYEDLCSITM